MTFIFTLLGSFLSGAGFISALIGFKDSNWWLLLCGFLVLMAGIKIEIWAEIKKAKAELRAEIENHLG